MSGVGGSGESEKDKKNADEHNKEKLREEIEKQKKITSKGRTPEEMASLQKQYDDAKKEKLKREMALEKYENDFLSTKVPKEKTDELNILIKKIANNKGIEKLEAQKEENIAKKIAIEKEIAQNK